MDRKEWKRQVSVIKVFKKDKEEMERLFPSREWTQPKIIHQLLEFYQACKSDSSLILKKKIRRQ